MGKTSAAKPKTAPAHDDIERLALSWSAKQSFLGAVLTLSWRLAVTVLVPVIGGIQLDKRFDSTPSYVLLGFMIAIVFGCMAVWQTVKEVNRQQAEAEIKPDETRKDT